MKLTKYDKQVFVRAVMADVKEPDYKETHTAIQDAIVRTMSPEVRDMYEKRPDALKSSYVYGALYKYGGAEFIVGDVDVDAIVAPWMEDVEARKKCEKNLENAIRSITTLKKLQDTFPELVRYMPSETGITPNLPATSNVIAELVKLGWKGNGE